MSGCVDSSTPFSVSHVSKPGKISAISVWLSTTSVSLQHLALPQTGAFFPSCVSSTSFPNHSVQSILKLDPGIRLLKGTMNGPSHMGPPLDPPRYAYVARDRETPKKVANIALSRRAKGGKTGSHQGGSASPNHCDKNQRRSINEANDSGLWGHLPRNRHLKRNPWNRHLQP